MFDQLHSCSVHQIPLYEPHRQSGWWRARRASLKAVARRSFAAGKVGIGPPEMINAGKAL